MTNLNEQMIAAVASSIPNSVAVQPVPEYSTNEDGYLDTAGIAKLQAEHAQFLRVSNGSTFVNSHRTVVGIDGIPKQIERVSQYTGEANPTILGSIRNGMGTPTSATSSYDPAAICTTPSGTMQVKSAIELGFLRVNDHGQLVEASATEQRLLSMTEERTTANDINTVTGALNGMNFWNDHLPVQVVDRAVNQIIDQFVFDKPDSGVDVKAIAAMMRESDSGITDSDAMNSMNEAMRSHQSATDKLVADAGFDTDRFYNWCTANKAHDMKAAMLAQFHQHNFSGWKNLIREYNMKGSEKPSLAQAKAKGFTPYKVGGKEMIMVNGLEMDLASAKRIGLI